MRYCTLDEKYMAIKVRRVHRTFPNTILFSNFYAMAQSGSNIFDP